MKPASIMIVEKDADLRNTLRNAFETRGYLTWTCLAPEIALSISAAVQPSVILFDLDSQTSDPLDLIDAWMRLAPPPRVIVESKSGDTERMRQAMEHGAHAYLIKPYSLAPLFDLLEKEIPPSEPDLPPIKEEAA